MINLLRILLLPVSLLYGMVMIVRNFLYDRGILKSHKFDLPVIVVGNLEVGGAGKTPVTEYLVRLLKKDVKVATLSRGYGRKTKGFLQLPAGIPASDGQVSAAMTAEVNAAMTGDEPFQYFSKFREITVAVGEDRVAAIEQLKEDHDVILLDDAFQHRRLDPGLSILVFDYNTLFSPRWLLPAGNYREPFYGRKRAGILIVSKAPEIIDKKERERILQRLDPASHQSVYFSSLRYEELKALYSPAPAPRISSETHVLLLTGIARPAPFASYIKDITPHVRHLKYPDHHSFTVENIAKIAKLFESIDSGDKLILTTEKDASRLRLADLKEAIQGLPVYYWPVRIDIHEPGKAQFDRSILNYVRSGQANG